MLFSLLLLVKKIKRAPIKGNKIKKDRILLAGLSQKKFLRLLFETKENHLNEQSLTAGIMACLGRVNILRVHQVKETVNLLRTLWPK